MDNHKNAEKPVEHIQAIIDALEPAFPLLKARNGDRFNLNINGQRMCFLLAEGQCGLNRGSDELTFTDFNAPGIMGLSDFWHDDNSLTVRAIGPIRYILAPVDAVLHTVGENNLWESTTRFLMYMATRYQQYLQQNTSVPTYTLVCNYLRGLIEEDFEVRAATTAERYIKERTNLSRSVIMKMLAQLNKGGYIIVKRGLLIKINHLPEKF
ncbi:MULTISPECIES: helix-turn-helix domain-containing protein [Rahnella]|uniref:helix-turn-helix domain-containing protein n=1 Tax=Rahnella TaxID=34037 RepID=UPI001265EA89|nr:helix-turn-helix domain-containing protein [Rahnella sp. ChDrAdgB13]KAB8311764.1 hypothetical protein EH227_01515 [Rouxiella chamberiensis]